MKINVICTVFQSGFISQVVSCLCGIIQLGILCWRMSTIHGGPFMLSDQITPYSVKVLLLLYVQASLSELMRKTE